jgi:DNA invertase Pin-like site-specific DNA recombinase
MQLLVVTQDQQMTTFAYVRVSTSEQAADDRTSLASQQRAAEAIATLRGESIAETVADAGISGSVPLTDRPGGGSMLAHLTPGDVIIAAKLDRLFRSARDALEMVDRLRERGVSVVLADMGAEPVTENGVSKLFFSILASVAEFERWRIAERMQEGRVGKRTRNGHIGGHAPYGFRVVGKGRAARLEAVAGEEAVIDRARTLRDAGMTFRAISAHLASEGRVSRSGRAFNPAQVRRMTAS